MNYDEERTLADTFDIDLSENRFVEDFVYGLQENSSEGYDIL